ncbi:uncharacterized protein LOC144657733 [Oculina patagonica]
MKNFYLWLVATTIWGVLSLSISLPVHFPNLALNMTTNQSTTFDQDGESDHAVDGILELGTTYSEPVQSCISTQIENNPWWMVDLGGIFQIEVVIITNKYQCWEDEFSEVELTIGFREDDPISTQQVCFHNLSHPSKGRIQVSCNQWPYNHFGRYFFLSVPKDNWFITFCELEVYPKTPRSLEENGLMFDSQSATWRPSAWLAVERYQNDLYMNVTLDSGSTEILRVQPADLYPDTPVHMGALDISDTVLAPFSWSLNGEPVYSVGTVIGMHDLLTYQVQSNGSVKYFNYSDLRHKDSCKLQTKCPANSDCTKMFMNEKFATFDYMCKCRAGFLSSKGNLFGVINEDFPEVCKGGVNLAGGKPTNQSDTLGDAVSSRAVDGNIDSRFHDGKSCSSTTKHANAWWRVDLGKLEFVAHLFIQFRYNCCESEATHFIIHVGAHLEDHFPVIGQEFKNYICSNFTVTDISKNKGWHVHCGRTFVGRYVYIRLLENYSLTLCEVYVYSEPNDNIALAQPNHTQAVDGDFKTCISVTTPDHFEPLALKIDLLYIRPVALVQVLSEVNMTDIAVIVGTEHLIGENCISSDGIVTANVLKEYVCDYPNRVRGRYVSVISANSHGSLDLCEVLVYAVYEYDLTWMGSAMQSSYFIPEMRAEKAFDDDRVTCTATKEETNPWWEIDLGSNHTISEVVIYTDDTLPHSSQYDVFVDQQLCGVANTTSSQLLSVICTPKAHGKVITVKSNGANTTVALCEVEVYAKVRVGYDDVCQSPYLCHSNHTCNNTGESYTCECPLGYKADPASTDKLQPVCIDVDECQSSSVCPNLVCNNTIGSYRCECFPGFVRNSSSQNDLDLVCDDINECLQLSDACRSDLTCKNIIGSYRCECPVGFYADPSSPNALDPVCVPDNDECLSPDACRSDLICKNTIGSYRCECPPGFYADPSFPSDLDPVCVDVDECFQSLNACRSDLICNNTIGSYRCDCIPGFYADPSSPNVVIDPVCVDIDECQSSHECRSGLVCNNTVGSYKCECPLGFNTDPGFQNDLDPVCIDIDECQLSGACRSDLDCKNTVGSYRCECSVGYTADPNSQNADDPVCLDVDECANSPESLGCSPLSECINFVGSYFCACKEGYLGDGRTCRESAAVFEMVCHKRGGVQQLFDQNENFRCKCAWGYVYDSQTNTCQRAG